MLLSKQNCLAHMEAYYLIKCVVKPVLNSHSKIPKLVFKTDYPLMQVKSIAECSKGCSLQYFRPSLSYHLPLISLFCLFLSGRSRQVLLYLQREIKSTYNDQTKIRALNSQTGLKKTPGWAMSGTYPPMKVLDDNFRSGSSLSLRPDPPLCNLRGTIATKP